MILYFNKNGQLLEKLTYGIAPRVGSTNFQIFAYFDGLNPNDASYSNYSVATIRLKRPDLEGSEYPDLFMTHAIITYDAFISNVSNSNFVDGQNYYGFVFDFSKVKNIEEDTYIKLLDTPGMWQASITLLNNSTGDTVTGLIEFYVEGAVSDADEDAETLDYTVIQQNIGNLLQDYALISGTIMVLSDITNPNIVWSNFNEGQLFYDKASGQYFRKINTTPYYEIYDNGILGSKRTALRINDVDFGSEDLQALYDLAGYRLLVVGTLSNVDYLMQFQVTNGAVSGVTLLRFSDLRIYHATIGPTGLDMSNTIGELQTATYLSHFATEEWADAKFFSKSGGTISGATKIEVAASSVPFEVKGTGSTQSSIKIWCNDNVHANYLGVNTYGHLVTYENGRWVELLNTYTSYTKTEIDSAVNSKRDLITTSTGYDQVYVRDINGNQTAINAVSNSKQANSIVKRRTDGHIYAGDIGDSFNDNDAVTKYYVSTEINNLTTHVDEGLATKLDKVTSTSPYALRLYAVSSAGVQQMLNVGEQALDIPQRKFNKQINVPLIPLSPDDATSKSYVDSKVQSLGSALIYKGSKTVGDINNLSTSSLSVGDVYNVSNSGTLTQGNIQVNAGDNVAWDGTRWDRLAGDIDLSNYITIEQLNTVVDSFGYDISQKQDKLVSGTNIKTIDGESLLGSGNIALQYLPVISRDVPSTFAEFYAAYRDNPKIILTSIGYCSISVDTDGQDYFFEIECLYNSWRWALSWLGGDTGISGSTTINSIVTGTTYRADYLVNKAKVAITLTSTTITLSVQQGVLPTHIELSNGIVLDLIGNKYYGDNDENVSASIVSNKVNIVITGDFSSLNSLIVTNMVWSIIQDPSNFSFDDLPRISDSSDVDDFPGSSGGDTPSSSGSSITRLTVGFGGIYKVFLNFACSQSELYAQLNQYFNVMNLQMGTSLNTNCASTSDIVANLDILKQIDTTGGSDPDNNLLVLNALMLLGTWKKCMSINSVLGGEYGTDYNCIDILRYGYSKWFYIDMSGNITQYRIDSVIGDATITYEVEIENL